MTSGLGVMNMTEWVSMAWAGLFMLVQGYQYKKYFYYLAL